MREQIKDTNNLRNDANFRVQIGKSLYWVPFNILGKTRYTNGDIKGFIHEDPYQKQKKMLNAYEAIQLLQLSGFQYTTDYRFIESKGRLWEHHKPAYWAIITNNGCCSSIVAWFNFIVHYTYVDMGYILISNPNGIGHVINCIYHNLNYYIFDLTTMIPYNSKALCIENGNKSEFGLRDGKIPVCLETTDLSNFVNYHSRMQKIKGLYPLYFWIEDNYYIPPINLEKTSEGMVINFSFKVIALNKSPQLRYKTIEGPDFSPFWLTEEISN